MRAPSLDVVAAAGSRKASDSMKKDERDAPVATSAGAGWFLVIIGGLFALAIALGLLTG